MGDNNKTPDSFEQQYSLYRDRDPSMSLTENQRILSDKIVTQYLSKNFNDESIPLDRIDLSQKGGYARAETELIARNESNWNPEHSDGIIIDFYNNIKNSMSPPLEKTEEQQQSDQNAYLYLKEGATPEKIIQNVIDNRPDLKGFTPADAKDIARADNNGTNYDTTQKFPDADSNTIKALAYTMLHNSDVNDQDLQGHDFAQSARSYMHYSVTDNTTYNTYDADRKNEVIADLAQNSDFMAALKNIRCPYNISTAEDLKEQFEIREQVLDTITTAYSKAHKTGGFLNENDSTVTYASRKQIEQDEGTFGYMGFKEIGILNDETIIVRYNPLYHLMENTHELAQTDEEEVSMFLRHATEEVQHAVHQMQTDQLILGSLEQDNPINDHATLGALNWLTMTDANDSHEAYKSQYVESTAKSSADDIAAEMVYLMNNPQEIVRMQGLESSNSDLNPIGVKH